MENIVQVSDLYANLPVKISDADIEEWADINKEKLNSLIKGESTKKVTHFLDTVHRCIYNLCIFKAGPQDLKLALIERYKFQVEKEIKIALLTQAEYLLSNGNIELFNGVVKMVGGVEYKEVSATAERILAPTIIDILSSTKPNLLFSGD